MEEPPAPAPAAAPSPAPATDAAATAAPPLQPPTEATAAAPESETSQPRRNIVIVGGGIIGSTTAYFLTRHPKFDPARHRITLLEASSIAAGASGKAGGLLGLWAYPQELVPLSYRLHRELAAEHGGAERWGYREVGCGSLSAFVTEDDLRPKKPKSEEDIDAATANQQQQQQQQSPLPLQPPLPPATANGTADPLPIQSGGTQENGQVTKDWEKLPKQDEAAARGSSLTGSSPLPADLDWIDGRLVRRYGVMGPPGCTDTAQVHPYQFTTSMARLAQEGGVDVRTGAKVTRIHATKAGGVQSVEYLDRETGTAATLPNVTDVVVTAGPWTGVLLPRSKVEGLRAHSVVWEADVSPYAVFTDIHLPASYVPEHRERAGQGRKHKGNVDPEIYARPGNEVYACGEPDHTVPLPATADQVQADTAQCDDLVAYVGTVSPTLAAAPVRARQACYLPRHMRFGDERGPLIGRTVTPGQWVAAGHTCWGIQNGPATGCLMAEMLLDGAAHSANVDKFDPRKFKV